MDSNVALLQALFFALAGWVACCYRITHSRLALRTRRLLILPLWFVWMGMALGGLVFQGTLTPAHALSTGMAVTAGMAMTLVARRGRRRSH